MNKLEILKKLAILRKDSMFESVGTLSNPLRISLIDYAKSSNNNIVENLNNRYSNAPDPSLFESYHSEIKNNYIQVQLPEFLKIEIDNLLKIKTASLKVAIMKPSFGLDWHVDFDLKHRLHCDLNLKSNFRFKFKDDEISLRKEVGEVYRINTSHYHKVFNDSNEDRYSLIGVLY